MRPLLLQSTTTHFAACSSQSSLQIAPALFLHSSASLHTLVRYPATQSFFSSRGTLSPLPLASPSRLVDHHRRLFPGGLPFRLAASKSTRFLLRLRRNIRAYWLHSCRACTSWGLPNQRVGVHWLRNQMLCPRQMVRHAQERENKRQQQSQMKRLQITPITKYIPCYIAGGGPIKQQRERGPHYHHNVQRMQCNNSRPALYI